VQALNGFILPILCIVLVFIVNDARLMTRTYQNGLLSNILLFCILFIMLLIGFNQIDKALLSAGIISTDHLQLLVFISLSIVMVVALKIGHGKWKQK
jgi:hypothetical protein